MTECNYRKICFERLSRECVVCGMTEEEHEKKYSFHGLHVHHIDGNRDNNSHDNLVPLCAFHHRKVHHHHGEDPYPIESDNRAIIYLASRLQKANYPDRKPNPTWSEWQKEDRGLHGQTWMNTQLSEEE